MQTDQVDSLAYAIGTTEWSLACQKMLREMEEAPAFGPTQVIMHPDIYDRWKHLLMDLEKIPYKTTKPYPNQEKQMAPATTSNIIYPEPSMGAKATDQGWWTYENYSNKPLPSSGNTNPCAEVFAASGAGWGIPVPFSSGSYTSSAPGKSSGAAQAVVQEAIKPAAPKSTTAEQEEWLARTVSDFETFFGAQPLLIDFLRTRLMTLPGYTYVNPT